MNQNILADRYVGTYLMTSDLNKINIPEVHQFLTEKSYWAKNIPIETVSTSMAHSVCAAILDQEKVIAFGRMITDRATFAYLCDIFVVPEYRGQQLSKALMQRFNELADAFGLRRTLLTTQDAHGLYAQFGFIPAPWPERVMYRAGVQYG